MQFIITSAILLLLSLSGCSSFRLFSKGTVPPSNQIISAPQRQAQVTELRNWSNKGAISVQYQGHTDIGSFDWRQRGDQYNMRVAGPLNLGGMRIQGSSGAVTLQQGNEPPKAASTPEALMQQTLGWSLPLTNFRYWTRGLIAPNQPSTPAYDRYGHLTQLQQQGWTIRYLGYQAAGPYDLPRTIVFNNQAIRVKMVIKQWLF